MLFSNPDALFFGKEAFISKFGLARRSNINTSLKSILNTALRILKVSIPKRPPKKPKSSLKAAPR